MEDSSHFSSVLRVGREGHDAIMKGGNAVMKLKIKQKKKGLFFLKVCEKKGNTSPSAVEVVGLFIRRHRCG